MKSLTNRQQHIFRNGRERWKDGMWNVPHMCVSNSLHSSPPSATSTHIRYLLLHGWYYSQHRNMLSGCRKKELTQQFIMSSINKIKTNMSIEYNLQDKATRGVHLGMFRKPLKYISLLTQYSTSQHTHFHHLPRSINLFNSFIVSVHFSRWGVTTGRPNHSNDHPDYMDWATKVTISV